jgi:hypothetical protein
VQSSFSSTAQHLRTIRICLTIVIIGLVLSGATAFALPTEADWLLRLLRSDELRSAALSSHLLPWVERVALALSNTNRDYAFLAYGTDWLAFAHLVIAVAFIGPYRDPLRNKWIITFGLIACAGVLPLALIAGQIRGIPIGWRLIDCSFGIFAAIPLLICTRDIRALELTKQHKPKKVRYAHVDHAIREDTYDWLH